MTPNGIRLPARPRFGRSRTTSSPTPGLRTTRAFLRRKRGSFATRWSSDHGRMGWQLEQRAHGRCRIRWCPPRAGRPPGRRPTRCSAGTAGNDIAPPTIEVAVGDRPRHRPESWRGSERPPGMPIPHRSRPIPHRSRKVQHPPPGTAREREPPGSDAPARRLRAADLARRSSQADWGDWRRGWDSNPRYGLSPYNGLANRRLQPLGHPSGLAGSTARL